MDWTTKINAEIPINKKFDWVYLILNHENTKYKTFIPMTNWCKESIPIKSVPLWPMGVRERWSDMCWVTNPIKKTIYSPNQ